MNWKIYYNDGSTYSDHDGDAFDAPGRGVQVIVIVDKDHGWRTQCGEHNYVWDKRGRYSAWWGCNDTGLLLYLLDPGPRKVIFGTQISRREFDMIFGKASQDPDFPEKTSYASGERI